MNLVSKKLVPDWFVVGIVAILPWITLLISLLSSEYADEAIQALRGEYTIHGIPHNPIRSFSPLFLLLNLTATAFAYGALYLARSSRLSTRSEGFRVVGIIVFVLLTAIPFTLALALASFSYCLFLENVILCSADPSLALVAFVGSFLILLLFNLIRLRGSIRSA